MTEIDEMNDEVVSEEYLTLDEKRTKSLVWAVLSMVFSALSIVLYFVFWVNLALAVLGILFSVISRIRMGYFHGLCVAGLIVGIVGTVLSIFYITVLASLFAALLEAFAG